MPFSLQGSPQLHGKKGHAIVQDMKKGIHPAYEPVIFEDVTSGARFLIGSTTHTKDKATWDDGKEYRHVTVEISSASHPVYTGLEVVVDTAGRVDKFNKRRAEAAKKRDSKKLK